MISLAVLKTLPAFDGQTDV